MVKKSLWPSVIFALGMAGGYATHLLTKPAQEVKTEQSRVQENYPLGFASTSETRALFDRQPPELVGYTPKTVQIDLKIPVDDFFYSLYPQGLTESLENVQKFYARLGIDLIFREVEEIDSSALSPGEHLAMEGIWEEELCARGIGKRVIKKSYVNGRAVTRENTFVVSLGDVKSYQVIQIAYDLFRLRLSYEASRLEANLEKELQKSFVKDWTMLRLAHYDLFFPDFQQQEETDRIEVEQKVKRALGEMDRTEILEKVLDYYRREVREKRQSTPQKSEKLRERFYQTLEAARGDLEEALTISTIHELGHMFGLYHPHQFSNDEVFDENPEGMANCMAFRNIIWDSEISDENGYYCQFTAEQIAAMHSYLSGGRVYQAMKAVDFDLPAYVSMAGAVNGWKEDSPPEDFSRE